MVDVPVATPVTMPVEEPTVATAVFAELQTPPGATLLNVVALPGQTVAVPVIAPALGMGLTVALLVALHPEEAVYEIRTVPTATPVTMPEVPTVATSVLLLVHVPPGARSINNIVLRAHT